MIMRRLVRILSPSVRKTGNVCSGRDIVNGKMECNEAGKMVERVWSELPTRFDIIELDEFTVMPNHFHGIVTLSGRGEACLCPSQSSAKPGDHKDRPYGTSMVSAVLDGILSPVNYGSAIIGTTSSETKLN